MKEPPTHNPFKLIYQVLKYAVKNKYPKQRSAFTYWEDKPYSRIDLGKAKYGGPFTTEQVEDVKTFFRLLIVIIASSPYMGVMYFLYAIYCDLIGFSKDHTECEKSHVTVFLSDCFRHNIKIYLGPISIVLLVPLFELILYPMAMMCSCAKKLRIKQKLLLGTFLLLVYEMYVLGLEIATVSLEINQNNTTCSIGEHNAEDKYAEDRWIILPQPILGIAIYIFSSSYLEFLCAQSPYSMKGLFVGVFYAVSMVSIAPSQGLLYLTEDWMNMLGSNCLMWLYVAILSLTAALICIQFISLKCYKLQRRDDVLRNDQMFAVNYFNKYLSPTPHPVHRHQ